MAAAVRPAAFWRAWLTVVLAAMLAMALAPLLAPGLVLRGMSLLFYADVVALERLGAPVRAYLFFAHAVMGALMAGWAALLLLVVRGPYARGSRRAWWAVALSVLAWFVPGTAFSLHAGAWPNVAVNLVFMLSFAVPLAATRRAAGG